MVRRQDKEHRRVSEGKRIAEIEEEEETKKQDEEKLLEKFR